MEAFQARLRAQAAAELAGPSAAASGGTPSGIAASTRAAAVVQTTGTPAAVATDVDATDPLGALIGGTGASVPAGTPQAAVQAGEAGAPAGTLAELTDAQLAGPPEPPPPPPANLFPTRLGQFVAPPLDSTRAASADGATPPDTPPVLNSRIPAQNQADTSIWQLSYSGRAAFDQSNTMRACPGGGTLSTGLGPGVNCRAADDVKMKESVPLEGGGSVEVVAQAKGTDATATNGTPTAVNPYQLLPQVYTAVNGISALDGGSVWAGRREVSPFLMSSGLLPPQSTAMRFGVDNARFGDVGLNYQYTSRDDTNGQNLPSYHSLRTAPLKTNDKGSVQLGFTRVEASPLVTDTGAAWWASAMHEQKGVLAGTNRFGMQYGAGSRTAMTGYTGMGADLQRMRVAESMEWKGSSGFGGSVEQSLQLDRSPIGTMQWVTTRVRPAYIASDQFKLTFEVAHDQISSGFGTSGQRTAVTVAPTFTLGKAAGNANLRAFYTYSKANDVDGITFAAPADAWNSQASGSIFGVQLNRRW